MPGNSVEGLNGTEAKALPIAALSIGRLGKDSNRFNLGTKIKYPSLDIFPLYAYKVGRRLLIFSVGLQFCYERGWTQTFGCLPF